MYKIVGKLSLKENIRKIGNLFSFVAVFILALGILVTTKLAQNPNTGKIQTKASAAKVSLSIYPTTETFLKDEVKSFQVIATFTDGSAQQSLDYFKTEILFDKEFLQMPLDKYVEATSSGFNRVFRVDGPTVANGNGKIIIELGADTPNSGPTTDKPINLAKFYLAGKNTTANSERISFGKIQVVSNQVAISVDDTQSTKGVTYTVLPQPVPTATPTLTPTPTNILPAITLTPTVTPSPTPTCNTKVRGDANCDGTIDGVDYSIWLNTQCHPAPNQRCLDTRADFSSPADGNVDDDDYYIWLSGREI